jgi:Flp pilus assembly protein TadG
MTGDDERGSAVVEMTWLGILLLVPLVYVMLSVFEVQRAAYGASAAGRAAGRAYVQSPDVGSAQQRGRTAAALVLDDHGIANDDRSVRVACTDGPCLSPGSSVTVTVEVRAPLPFVPDFLGGARPAVRVSSSHTEPYGRFREDRS